MIFWFKKYAPIGEYGSPDFVYRKAHMKDNKEASLGIIEEGERLIFSQHVLNLLVV